MLRLLTIVVLVLATAGVASAATTTPTTPPPTPPLTNVKLTPKQSKLLWATVNICDTDMHPDTIGVAGSMPMLKTANRLYMRFRVQYRDEVTKTFKAIPGDDSDSEWELVDPGTGKARQAGHDFTLAAPKKESYVVRGQVSYQWRKGKTVVLNASRFTTVAHPKTKAADPKKYSAAICTIK